MKIFLLHPACAIYYNLVNFQLVDNAVVPRVAQTLEAMLVCHWGNLIGYFLSKNYFITVSSVINLDSPMQVMTSKKKR